MAVLLAAIYLLAWGSGCGLALAVLVYAIVDFLQAISPDSPPLTLYLVASMICAVPLAALLAGYLFDQFLLRGVRGRAFTVLSIPLIAVFFFGNGTFLGYLEAAVDVLQKGDKLSAVLLLCSLTSSVFFCGGVVAMCLTALCVVVEVPLRWLAAAQKLRLPLAFEGIRTVLIIVLLSACANLVLSLYVRELWPTALTQFAGG
jgi:hypothetical protein